MEHNRPQTRELLGLPPIPAANLFKSVSLTSGNVPPIVPPLPSRFTEKEYKERAVAGNAAVAAAEAAAIIAEGEHEPAPSKLDNLQRNREADDMIDNKAEIPPPTGSTDAAAWAESFVDHVKRNPAIATDVETALVWFTIAMEAMRGPTPEIPDGDPAFTAGREFDNKAEIFHSPKQVADAFAELEKHDSLVTEPADDAPDAPIERKPCGGWSEEDPGDEETFRQLDGFLTAFMSPIENGLGSVTGEDIDDMIFVEFFSRLAAAAHRDMIDNGFWEDSGALEAKAAIQKIGDLKQGGSLQNLSPREVNGIQDLVMVAVDRSEQPPRDVLASLMLMVTELAEAAEGFRKGGYDAPDDKIPEFTSLEAELADVVLRIMDFAGGHELRIAEAIVAKRNFNRTRERLHGKTC